MDPSKFSSFFKFSNDYDNGKGFKRYICRRFCGCSSDFIDVLVAGYQAEIRKNWERCLDMKWSILDCVSGCHTIEPESDCYDRNGHQYRITTEAINNSVKELCDFDWDNLKASDFEEFYDAIAPKLKVIDGIGELSTYDTILRLAWHCRKGRISPSAFVYLHAGALEGAKALSKISLFSKKKYLNILPETLEQLSKCPPVRIDIREFSRALRLIDANHLENFLCVFHNLLEAYADFLEKKELEKTKNSNNK